MLDNAILERTRRYDLLVRLGVSDPPKVGYMSLDEIDYKTVHEAFQLLNKKYLGEDIEDTKSYSTFLTIEEIRAKHANRRNSCKAKIQLNTNHPKPEPNLTQNTSSLMVQDAKSYKFSKRRNSCKAKLGINNDDSNTESEKKVLQQSKVDSRRRVSKR